MLRGVASTDPLMVIAVNSSSEEWGRGGWADSTFLEGQSLGFCWKRRMIPAPVVLNFLIQAVVRWGEKPCVRVVVKPWTKCVPSNTMPSSDVLV